MHQESTSIPSLSVAGAVEQLAASYTAAILGGIPQKSLPAVMLWGPPGVGKSQAVRQVAREIERKTGKECRVTDVRLLLFNPIDLRGIPTANADKTLAVWLRPKIFQMDESDKIVNILFLDEISAAPQSVQAAAYQITLDRVVGEHRLPDNCIVIAAGNRVTDRSVAFKMPRALANRLCHLEIVGNHDSWMRWAVEHGIHEKVLGFLSFRADYLMENDIGSDELAFATPRSWEMVSNLLRVAGGDTDSIYPMIAGCVGTGVAVEFCSYCKIFATLPRISDIFDGRAVALPKSPDAMYALISAMTAYAKEHKDELSRIGSSIAYAKGMPPDFAAVLLKNYMSIEKGYRDRLMTLPDFAAWLRTKGALLNGFV